MAAPALMTGPHVRRAADDLYAKAAAEFADAVDRLARGYEADPDRRRDLRQEIHVALWRSLHRFDGRCSLRTWVYQVAHNTATSKVLRPRRRGPVLVGLDEIVSEPAVPPSQETAFDEQRTLERLLVVVRQLKPLDRQVILLYLEGENAASISEVTGLSTGAVATKVHRIKLLLARQFQHGVSDGR